MARTALEIRALRAMLCKAVASQLYARQVELQGLAGRFLALHQPGKPLLQPNAWDLGSARVLEALGFSAIATTSGGFAGSLGRLDGAVERSEVLAHCTALSGAVSIPVAADMENGFADDPEGVADTVARAAETGLAGCSIEDFTRRLEDPIYELELATERVVAAAEAAHGGPHHLVLTARAENHIRGRDDLADTVARLQAYEAAGADVLFAPGVRAIDDIRRVVSSVGLPVNVLVQPGTPPVAELAAAGVARISVGGGFAYAAYSGLIESATELREAGTYGYLEAVSQARPLLRRAFAPRH